MIVEFTGCSGAGKTSLARRVRELLRAQQLPVSEPFECIARGWLPTWLGNRCASSTSAANLAVELFGCRSTLLARRQFAECDRWIRAQIREVSLSRREWIRLSRSWNRKIAVIASQTPSPASQLLLHDEGTVHFATTLIARSQGCLLELLEQYLDLVPLPDQIVCVSASPVRSAQRLTQRSFQPAPDRRDAAHERFLGRAREVMERLCEHPRIAPQMLHAQNESNGPHALDALARAVAKQLVPTPLIASPPGCALEDVNVTKRYTTTAA